MAPIVIGTRATPLARIQADLVARRLGELGVETEVRAMSSQGDRSLGGSFAQAKGVFTGELSAALRNGAVDLVVHSLKDLPVEDEPDLVIAAVPVRERPFDLLLFAPGLEAGGDAGASETSRPLAALLDDDEDDAGRSTTAAADAFGTLPSAARLGTSSPRRQAGALAIRPDLVCCAVRGSVGRRLEWLRSGAIDALLAAEAGVLRLARSGQLDPPAAAMRGFRLDLRSWPCAPGQGALAVQILRGGRLDGHAAMAALDDPPSRAAAFAERSLLGRLGGGCLRPFGAWADVRAAGPEEPGRRLGPDQRNDQGLDGRTAGPEGPGPRRERGPSGDQEADARDAGPGGPVLHEVHALIAADDWREPAGVGEAPSTVHAAASVADRAGSVDLDALAERIEKGLGASAADPEAGGAGAAGARAPSGGSGADTPNLIVASSAATRTSGASPAAGTSPVGAAGARARSGRTGDDTPDLVVTSSLAAARRLTRRLDSAVRVAALPATAVEIFDAPWPTQRIDLNRPRRQWPWLLVSSPTAAGVVADRAMREPAWGRLPWCALGEGTARTLLAAGVPPNLAARASNGKELARYAARVLDPRCPLFVPHSARGGARLVDALEAAGRQVTAWAAYTVHPNHELDWPEGWQAAHARVLFTAPSAVAAFAESGLNWPRSCWAIGAATAAALHSAGVGNVKCAEEPTAAGIARLWLDEAGRNDRRSHHPPGVGVDFEPREGE